MSYCVNCGVKLAPTESHCPLCSTQVVNPATPEPENRVRAYPENVEPIAARRVNLRFLSRILIVFFMLCALILVVCDLITMGQLTWSIYAVICAVYISCCCGFLYFRSPFVSLPVWTGGNLFLLGMIAHLIGTDRWFYALAVPICLAAGLYLLFCVWSLKKRKNILRSVAFCLLFCDVVLIGIECLVDLYADGVIALFWSVYAVLPIVAISILLVAISCSTRLLDEIRRRVFL